MITPKHLQRLHTALDALPTTARLEAVAALRAAQDDLKTALSTAPNWDTISRLQGAVAVIYEIIPTKERNA